jgi:predicted GNAT family N-acyltransferase
MSDAVPVDIVRIETLADMEAALDVRRAVFIGEQNVPAEIEIDEHDGDPAAVTTAVHALARVNGEVVATGRLLLDAAPGDNARIGRVAVLPRWRGTGVGRAVMRYLEDEARQRGYGGITVNAQVTAVPFYLRLGYVQRGEIFLEAGIEHVVRDVGFGGSEK